MSATAINPGRLGRVTASRCRRFERILITSVFGDPRGPRTWSGAPNNLAAALERLGVAVEGFHPTLRRSAKLAFAARHVVGGFGRLAATEQILRGAPARLWHARQVAATAARLGIRHVLHTGAFDLPALDLLRGVKHYLYCDQTWALSTRYRPDAGIYRGRALNEFERLECESLIGLDHVFTFGAYVRDNLIEHYGVRPDKVSAVGSGMGGIEPYFGPKDYSKAALLFVAKHLFVAKGGQLLVDAFLIARRQRPDLVLTIVGDERSRRFLPRGANVHLRAHVPWQELQQLYRNATLLVQPMLNDPWGQVYLEALASRTPVLGLNRNGLPEITRAGRYGFLVEKPEPRLLAEAILDALSQPRRLAQMALGGQRHVLNAYDWRRVAERIAFL